MGWIEVAGIMPGALLGAAGLALLAALPRRAGAAMFAAYAVVWSAEITTFGLLLVFPHVEPRPFFLLGLAFIIVETLFLVRFAVAFARPSPRQAASWTWSAIVLATVSAAILTMRPDAFVAGGSFTSLATAVVIVPNYAALYVAIVIVLGAYLRAPTSIDRRESTFVLAALGILAGQVTGANLAFYGLARARFVEEQGDFSANAFLLLFAAGTVLLSAVAARLVARARSGRFPEKARADLATGGAIAAALVVGFAFALPVGDRVVLLSPAPLTRLAAVALVAYGLVKYHLFGIDLRLKRVVAAGFPFAAGGAVEVAAGLAVGPFLNDLDGPTLVLVSAGLFVVAAAIAAPLRKRVANAIFPYVDETDAYLRARGLEVYRAALAQSLDRGVSDDDFLKDMRTNLGIRAKDHARILAALTAERGGPHVAEGTLVAGRYRRDARLGANALARSWRGTDVLLDRSVVLKELQDPAYERFLEEMRRVGSTDSPHLVRVLDAVRDGEAPVLVLDHVPGGTLEERLRQRGRLPRAEAVAVACDMLRGLAALHARGGVHRNLKPSNVLFAEDGRAKLTDYGIVAVPPGADLATRAAAGVATEPGTLHYASPEEADGAAEDARSDIWSVGAILYRALSGRFAFDFGNAGEYEIRRRIVEEAPALPLDGETGTLNEVLARALAKNPADRFPDADTMRVALEAAVTPDAAHAKDALRPAP